MDLKYRGVCRGDGFIYAKYEVFADLEIQDISLEVTTGDGRALPSRVYELVAPVTKASKKEIVAVLPLLETGSQVITVRAELVDGSNEFASDKLSMLCAKWESRINYRVRKNLANEMRDIEKHDVFSHVNFWIEHAVEADGTGELVVHGGVWYCNHDSVDLSYELIWENGSRTALKPIIMSKEPRAYGFDPRFMVDSELLSFRIPATAKSFTIIAIDRHDPDLWGFTTFDAARLGWFIEIGQSMHISAGADPAYHKWFLDHRADLGLLKRQRGIRFEHNVLFSIVVPLFCTPPDLFHKMVESVLNQSYERWELVLVNATPGDEALACEIAAYQHLDERIRVVVLSENLGIVGNTNCGIGAARGDYICFLDHDDEIEPNALFEYACVIEQKPETGMIYCDEDKLLKGGYYANPFFKTDFNIDLLRCHNYICHFLCVRNSLLEEVGLSEERHNGAQDHDIALKCAERTSGIEHVAKVLYHWRVVEGSTASADLTEHSPKEYANDAGAEAIRDHLKRLGINAVVEPTQWAYAHHVKYLVSGSPIVSIVIPNKDCAEMLDNCVRSIVDKTSYKSYEILVVENNSTEQETFAYYKQLEERYPQARVVRWPHEFNFSKIVNFGAAEARGDFLLFLNNDTEVIKSDWLENMLGVCQRDDVGVVGAKLLYRDGTLQHAGVVLADSRGVAHHAYSKMPEEYSGYFLQACLTMDYSAVTGACMLTKRSVFDAVGGFDEGLAVAFNDIDYCLKVRAAGKLVVYEPTARLYHFESISRGYDLASTAKQARLLRESGIMYQRWAEIYFEGDPYFNPHLSSGYHKLKLE